MSDKKIEMLDEQVLTVRCPKCNHDSFEEVQVDVVVSTAFKSVTYFKEEDHIDLDYGNAENHGGTVDRYQCANCGHVVAKGHSEFRDWIKEHGKK